MLQIFYAYRIIDSDKKQVSLMLKQANKTTELAKILDLKNYGVTFSSSKYDETEQIWIWETAVLT